MTIKHGKETARQRAQGRAYQVERTRWACSEMVKSLACSGKRMDPIGLECRE